MPASPRELTVSSASDGRSPANDAYPPRKGRPYPPEPFPISNEIIERRPAASGESLPAPNADGNKGVFSILKRLRLFSDFIPAVLEGLLDGSIDPELPRRVTKTAWLDSIEAADEFNDPGAFTTFVAFEEAGIVNPFKFGFIAASDTHVGATTDDESNFHLKIGLLDDRDAIRKAYASGVPMSGDLPGGGETPPRFFAYAMRDAQSASLQRHPDRKGLGRRRRNLREGLRRRMLGWRHARSEDTPLSRQRCPRRPARLFLFARSRCGPAHRTVAGPRLRPRPARLLLCPRAGEPYLPLVDVGRPPQRRRTPTRPACDTPGTRLVVADLVRALASIPAPP